MTPFIGRRAERAQVLVTAHNVALVAGPRTSQIHYVGDADIGKTSLIGQIGTWLKETEKTDFIDIDLSDPYCHDEAIKLKYIRDLASDSLIDIDLSAFDFLFLIYDYGHRSSILCAGGLKRSSFSPEEVLEEGILDGLKQSTTATLEELKKTGITVALSGAGSGAAGALTAIAAKAASVLSAGLVTGAAAVGAVSTFFLGRALLAGAFARARRQKVFKDQPELARLVGRGNGGRAPRADEMLALLPKLLASAIKKALERRGSVLCIGLDPAESMKSRDPEHGVGKVTAVLSSILKHIPKAVVITTSKSSYQTWSSGRYSKAVAQPSPLVHLMPELSISDVREWLEEKGIPQDAALARLFGKGRDTIAPRDFEFWWNERGHEIGASAVS